MSADEQLSFSWLVPPQDFFSAKEVAGRLDMSPQFIRDCLEDQRIKGHGYQGKSGQYKTWRIPKAAVVELVANSANYEPEELVEVILNLIDQLPPEALVRAQARVARKLKGQS